MKLHSKQVLQAPDRSFFDSPGVIEFFKHLFLKLYGQVSPVLTLDKLAHWIVPLRERGLEELPINQIPTMVLGGYFYNFSTPIPKDLGKKVEEYLQGELLSQMIVPTVPEELDASPFLALGFQKVPAFVESAFTIETNVHDDIRSRVGGKKYRGFKALLDRAENDYELNFFTGSGLLECSGILQIADYLHSLNVRKYKHPVNLYDLKILQEITHLNLLDHFFIGIRVEKRSKRPIQALIGFVDQGSSELYLCVQGIDHKYVEKKQNLYKAAIFQTYLFAESLGIRKVFLGRGCHEEKKKLGANIFRNLNHWVLNTKLDISSQVLAINSCVAA